jgi:hypothetical protein
MDAKSRVPNECKYQVEGIDMRIFVALAVIAASVALGGCFHHTQQVYTAELPTPVEVPPYK